MRRSGWRSEWRPGRKTGGDNRAEEPFPAGSHDVPWSRRDAAVAIITFKSIARKGANIPVSIRNTSCQWTIPSQRLIFPIHLN